MYPPTIHCDPTISGKKEELRRVRQWRSVQKRGLEEELYLGEREAQRAKEKLQSARKRAREVLQDLRRRPDLTATDVFDVRMIKGAAAEWDEEYEEGLEKAEGAQGRGKKRGRRGGRDSVAEGAEGYECKTTRNDHRDGRREEHSREGRILMDARDADKHLTSVRHERRGQVKDKREWRQTSRGYDPNGPVEEPHEQAPLRRSRPYKAGGGKILQEGTGRKTKKDHVTGKPSHFQEFEWGMSSQSLSQNADF